jgi:hypothetical protein
MYVHKFWVHALVSIALGLTLVACADKQASDMHGTEFDTTPVNMPAAVETLQHGFLKQTQSLLTVFPFQDPSEDMPVGARELQNTMAKAQGAQIASESLSQLDRLRLGVVACGDSFSYLPATIHHVGSFYFERGRLPLGGEELMAGTFVDQAAWNHFLELSEEERLQQCLFAIDPIAEDFFNSFECPQWQAHGLDCRPLNSTEILALKDGYDLLNTPSDGVPLTGAMKVTAYGDTPGEVLFSEVFTFYINEDRGHHEEEGGA